MYSLVNGFSGYRSYYICSYEAVILIAISNNKTFQASYANQHNTYRFVCTVTMFTSSPPNKEIYNWEILSYTVLVVIGVISAYHFSLCVCWILSCWSPLKRCMISTIQSQLTQKWWIQQWYFSCYFLPRYMWPTLESLSWCIDYLWIGVLNINYPFGSHCALHLHSTQ